MEIARLCVCRCPVKVLSTVMEWRRLLAYLNVTAIQRPLLRVQFLTVTVTVPLQVLRNLLVFLSESMQLSIGPLPFASE